MDKKAAERLLGGDPGKGAIKTALTVAVGGPIVIALWFGLGFALDWAALAVIGFIVGFFWIIGTIASLVAVLLALAARRHFKPALAAVLAGELNVSWFFYGHGYGLVVVDELGRKLFVNGSIRDFADVKEIEWTTSGKPAHLRVVLRSGANPVLTVPLSSSDDASLVGHRLHNALGFAAGQPARPPAVAHDAVSAVQLS